MTQKIVKNLSRRPVTAMLNHKSITKKADKQSAQRQQVHTRDEVKSHKFSKDSNVLANSKCKISKPTYLSPVRERSYTPLRAQKPYAEPVSDQYVPVGNCFVEPAATMQQFKEKIAAERL